MTNTLSPASKAVLDAALPVYDDEHLYVAPMEKHAGMIAAAALRAAAANWRVEFDGQPQVEFIRGVLCCAEALEEIATELERQ